MRSGMVAALLLALVTAVAAPAAADNHWAVLEDEVLEAEWVENAVALEDLKRLRDDGAIHFLLMFALESRIAVLEASVSGLRDEIQARKLDDPDRLAGVVLEPRSAAEQATDVSRRVFRGEGRFGLQYQEPGLKCQVRDRLLDITLILESDGKASLEFSKWPRTEGLPTKLKGEYLVSKVWCFMGDDQRIYPGTWRSNGDGTVDVVIDFLDLDEKKWPVTIKVDAKIPAAAGTEYRVAVHGKCPGKKWSAKKTDRRTLRIGKTVPKAKSFRCYLFDFILFEEAG